MNPRLVVIAGLPETKTFEIDLNDGEFFTLGRSLECDLPIENIAVSRRHCTITKVSDVFRLDDLNSHNGTFVNGLQTKSQTLKHGDQINLGNLHIMFLIQESAERFEPEVAIDDGSLVLNSTIKLFPHLNAAELSSDLNTLVKLGKAINEIKSRVSLQRRFLEIIFEFIPAQRGAILLTDNDLHETQSVSFTANDVVQNEPMQLSRTVCRQVLSENVALLSNDLSDSQLSAAESLIASQISSILCVPLNIGAKKGLIYLDTNNLETRFSQNHLEQITAVSFLISAALTQTESLENLREENAILRQERQIETDLIGESDAMEKVFQRISKVSPTDSTVLINGESGTGKELLAKSIHVNSLRREKMFVAINCATLGENLIESELFGHEKGAFTGAHQQKKGKLEIAAGGTLFLDEIGELALPLQAKLLRVLQEREFERVGGLRPIKADIRLIAATNRELEEEVKKGKFREDLFFRLNVIKIKMPPLRERRSDISLLANYFVKKYAERCNRNVSGISETARKMLTDYDWNGNVRQLENAIEYALVLGSTEMIEPEDLPDDIIEFSFSAKDADGNFHERIKAAKQKIITEELEKNGGNRSETARRLGIHPNNLHRVMKNLGMKSD
ncbi:MAG TPA: sigma 54-interacting transcriptional regulator [Pyrinomonadaceae bacterium]|nr:sigma 54-interacting transcriptional regulator [Pyrinomonadaceae bacterium]